MPKQTSYQAKRPDEQGFIFYTKDENQVWHDLVFNNPMLNVMPLKPF